MNFRYKVILILIHWAIPCFSLAYNGEVGSSLDEELNAPVRNEALSYNGCKNLQALVDLDQDGVDSAEITPLLQSTIKECERISPNIAPNLLETKYSTNPMYRGLPDEIKNHISLCAHEKPNANALISKYYYYIGRSYESTKYSVSHLRFMQGLILSLRGKTSPQYPNICDKIKFSDLKTQCQSPCQNDTNTGSFFLQSYQEAFNLRQQIKVKLLDRLQFLQDNPSGRMESNDPISKSMKNEIAILESEFPLITGDFFKKTLGSATAGSLENPNPLFKEALLAELQKTEDSIIDNIAEASSVQNCLGKRATKCDPEKIFNTLKEMPYLNPSVGPEGVEVSAFNNYQNCLYDRKVDKNEIRRVLSGLSRDAVFTFASMGLGSIFTLGPRTALLVNTGVNTYFATPSVQKAYHACSDQFGTLPQMQLYQCDSTQNFVAKMNEHTSCISATFMAALDGAPIAPSAAKFLKGNERKINQGKAAYPVIDSVPISKMDNSYSSKERSFSVNEIEKERREILQKHFPQLSSNTRLAELGETIQLSAEEQRSAEKLSAIFKKGESLAKKQTLTADEVQLNNSLLNEAADELVNAYRKEGFEVKTTPILANFGRKRSLEMVKKLENEITDIESKLRATNEEIKSLQLEVRRSPSQTSLLQKINFKEQVQNNFATLLNQKKRELQEQSRLAEVARIDEIQININGSMDPKKDKLLRNLQQKLGVSDVQISINRDYFRGFTGGKFKPSSHRISMDGAGQFIPRYFLKEPSILHEINHAYNESSKLKRKDLPFYGTIKFLDSKDSLITLNGYQDYMSVDEISAYKKTVAWSKAGRDVSVTPSSDFQVSQATEYRTIDYLFKQREASRSTLQVIDRVVEQLRDPAFSKQISYRIRDTNEAASTATIPILNESKQPIGVFEVDLVKLSNNNEESSEQIMRNYLQQMRSSAESEFINADTEIGKFK